MNCCFSERLALHLHARGEVRDLLTSVVGRIATTDVAPEVRPDHVRLWRDDKERAPGSAGYAATVSIPLSDQPGPGISGVEALAYLDDGDVVALHPSGVVQVLYRRS